jgi:hypothetical protein
MSLLNDTTSFLLVPAEDGGGLVMGTRGGVTFASGQGTYWPFRPLNPIERREFASACKGKPRAVHITRRRNVPWRQLLAAQASSSGAAPWAIPFGRLCADATTAHSPLCPQTIGHSIRVREWRPSRRGRCSMTGCQSFALRTIQTITTGPLYAARPTRRKTHASSRWRRRSSLIRRFGPLPIWRRDGRLGASTSGGAWHRFRNEQA